MSELRTDVLGPAPVVAVRPEPVGEVQVRRMAQPAAVPALRAITRRWLTGLHLDPDVAEDIVLAVDEATTNAVEHAFLNRPEGVVSLELKRSADGGVEVAVADDGTWRPVPEDQGFRGRGLPLIHRLADQAGITHAGHGTVVRMAWVSGWDHQPRL